MARQTVSESVLPFASIQSLLKSQNLDRQQPQGGTRGKNRGSDGNSHGHGGNP